MTVLITGGASKIGTRLAHLLKDASRDVMFASRSGRNVPEGFQSTKLDWYDPSTFLLPFQDRSIEVVYLLPPPADLESSKAVIPFIDLAVEKGVKRFIMLSGTQVEKNGNAVGLGVIHRYLHDKGLDYVALRPTSFTENLITNDIYSIRANSEIVNSWSTARIPFVATEDIARVAFDSIVNVTQPAKEIIILGPEAITCEELAAITSEVLGRPIKYRAISLDEMKQIFGAVIKKDYADALADYYASVEAGGEDNWLKLSAEEKERMGIAVVVGKVTVKEWLKKNKSAFE
ncbi:NmrA family protein [Coprinopsis sp. MPI-PUGE-AT-0042]|nr:NmrA family protein [Coprinopsis sp. MPI-PUGE-AT-0042]